MGNPLSAASTPRRTRPVLTVLLTALLTLVGTLSPGWARPAATSAPPVASAAADDGRVEPRLQRQFDKAAGDEQEFWVQFADPLGSSDARRIEGWKERGAYVVRERRETAERSQAEAIELLDSAGVDFTAYWITNAVHVAAGDRLLAATLASLPGVEEVRAPVRIEAPEPINPRLAAERANAAVEWGIANIKADQAWDQYGVRGDGIVVASIDTGVQYDHPALVDSYRGNNHDGTFSHDYNWFDVQGSAPAPYDNNGHGTHTMGTMVGDDGGSNRLGVAPGATWIATNGCCPSDEALIASAQWLLAPTDSEGNNPRPELRPNIINNSWGSTEPTNEPFMEDLLLAWQDAGIFGVFANGNSGSECNTSGSPGSRSVNYSVGAYDSANQISSFSGRGSGQDGDVKPDISAPGQQVRSSYAGGGYASISGTSMATPHVAGAVALAWSADPTLVGEVAATRQLLDDTATDAPDSTCGGTDDDNNVYGEGRLDALALVAATDQGELGTITGHVTSEGDPVPNAAIRLSSAAHERSTRTSADGAYTTHIPPGIYQASVTSFGFEPEEVTLTVEAGATTTTDIALTRVEGYSIKGRVVDGQTGRPVPGATVSVPGSRYTAIVDSRGAFTVPHVPGPATYEVKIDGGGCTDPRYREVEVSAEVDLGEIALHRRTDQPNYGTDDPPYGYSCLLEPRRWVPGKVAWPVPEPRSSTRIRMPFAFTYFGKQYRSVFADGLARLSFWTLDDRGELLDGLKPHYGTATSDEQTKIFTTTGGRAPNRTFTVEFRDLTVFVSPQFRWDAEVTFHESGEFVFAYRGIDADLLPERGQGATVEIDSDGPPGYDAIRTFTYSQDRAILDDARQIRFSPPPNGFVDGRVVNKTTGKGVPGATVTVTDGAGRIFARSRTDAAGRYRTQLFKDRAYRLAVVKPYGYRSPKPVPIRITKSRQVLRHRTTLVGARMKVRPRPVVIRQGRSAQVSLKNTGEIALGWRIAKYDTMRDTPRPGTELRNAQVPAIALGVEDVDGHRWVSGADFTTGSDIWRLIQTTAAGHATGETIPVEPVARALDVSRDFLAPNDLAWVPSRRLLCLSIAQPRMSDLACVDPTGRPDTMVRRVISPGFGLGYAVKGLAYAADRDLFYVYGAPPGQIGIAQINTLAGLEHSRPGRVLNTCTMRGDANGGLAYNPTSRSLYSNTFGGQIEFDPTTCGHMSTTSADYSRGGSANGLGIDDDGNLLVAQPYATSVADIKTGNPFGERVPWLRVSRASGSLKVGHTQRLTIKVSWSRVPDGVTGARLEIRGNGGARTRVVVPITLRR